MDPAPLCKTAILSFIIDETITKFWNVSSISRKRTQMIVGEKRIKVKEYNESALKMNGWVKVGKNRIFTEGIESIKKGVSNYRIKTQEELERVISLNGKLRCYNLRFTPEIPIEFDCFDDLLIYPEDYDCYSKCSFNKISLLCLKTLSSNQIKEILAKCKQIHYLKIYSSTISNLDLSSLNVRSIYFSFVTVSGKNELPSNLLSLKAHKCKNINLLNYKRLTEICFSEEEASFKNSLDCIEKAKNLKTIEIHAPLTQYINYLPPTTRELGCNTKIYGKNTDLSNIKEKLPFLISISSRTPIEMAQILNLRTINPIINQTKAKFAIRPRKILVSKQNVRQLAKHPELFEKVEKIKINCDGFNFDCLPGGMKEIEFHDFSIREDKFESLQENNWKFEESNVSISSITEDHIRKILNSLKKVRKITLFVQFNELLEDFPQFKLNVK